MAEDGVSLLEYVLLVALVALVATGSLLYLGRGSASPSHIANHVGSVASVTNPGGGGARGALDGTSTGTPVKAWCTSGGTRCSDPMLMNGQSEIIHFWATGGTGNYTYQLQGSVPAFMIPDWPDHEITIQPMDCSKDLGTYLVSLVVSDNAGDTGTLKFSLNIAKGSLC